jgi:hypothetical protein
MYIDPRMENPENRNFKRQGLIDDARRDRAALLAACFTIAIAYSRAGCPIDSLRLRGFNEWRELVQKPLIWLGEPDPVQSQRRIKHEDPVKQQISSLLRIWRSLFGDRHMTVADVLTQSDAGVSDDLDADESKQKERQRDRDELARILADIALDPRTGKAGTKYL